MSYSGLDGLRAGFYAQPSDNLQVDAPLRGAGSSSLTVPATGVTGSSLFCPNLANLIKLNLNDGLLIEAALVQLSTLNAGVTVLACSGLAVVTNGAGVTMQPVCYAQNVATGLAVPSTNAPTLLILQPYAAVMLAQDVSLWAGVTPLTYQPYPLTIANIGVTLSLQNTAATSASVLALVRLRLRMVRGIQEG